MSRLEIDVAERCAGSSSVRSVLHILLARRCERDKGAVGYAKGTGGGGEAFLGWLSDCQSLKKDTAT